ncbi:MAG: putative MetA-pathway of phenol degradation [Myxococcaceae bacterium]|nr:putative MetA-pathway of phenol degradation [Myxococcaceae bacterium]
MKVARLAVALALATTAAEASPCCLSASAFGVGRLAPWESAAAISGVSVAAAVGWWDESGRFYGDAAGSSDLELRVQQAAVVSLVPGVELSGRVPWVLNRRTADGLAELGNGAGDGALGLRAQLTEEGDHGPLPAIALNLGLTLPFGRPMAISRSLLASDVTGRGAWALAASLSFEYVSDPWYLQVNAGGLVPLPMASYLPGISQRFGPGLDLSIAGGRELTSSLVVSVLASLTLESALVLGDSAVAGSQAHTVMVSPSLSWKFSPHWTLQASVESGVFLTGFGANRQGRAAISTALRYGFF